MAVEVRLVLLNCKVLPDNCASHKLVVTNLHFNCESHSKLDYRHQLASFEWIWYLKVQLATHVSTRFSKL